MSMIEEPYRDSLIDTCNGYASDVVQLFEVDEYTVNEFQPFNRRT